MSDQSPPSAGRRRRPLVLALIGVLVLVVIVGVVGSVVMGAGSGGSDGSVATSPATPTPSLRTDAMRPKPDFSYREFAADWDYELGSADLYATFRNGRDLEDCSRVQQDGEMDDLGCVRASQWTYRALAGRLKLTHIVYTMRSNQTNSEVIDDIDDAWSPAAPDEVFTDGELSWRAAAVGRLILVTMVSHEGSVDDKTAAEYLSFASNEFRVGLERR